MSLLWISTLSLSYCYYQIDFTNKKIISSFNLEIKWLLFRDMFFSPDCQIFVILPLLNPYTTQFNRSLMAEWLRSFISDHLCGFGWYPSQVLRFIDTYPRSGVSQTSFLYLYELQTHNVIPSKPWKLGLQMSVSLLIVK